MKRRGILFYSDDLAVVLLLRIIILLTPLILVFTLPQYWVPYVPDIYPFNFLYTFLVIPWIGSMWLVQKGTILFSGGINDPSPPVLIDWPKDNEETEDVVEEERIKDHPVFPHTLFYGPAGMGKSTITELTVKELENIYGHGIKFITVTPSQIKSKVDLDKIMMNLEPYSCILIDEIHGLKMDLEEALYSAMQDGVYDMTGSDRIDIGSASINVSTNNNVERINLPKFTMFGATTLVGDLNEPLRQRFRLRIKLEPYSREDLANIAMITATKSKPQTLSDYVGQASAKNRLDIAFKALNSDTKTKFMPDAYDEISSRSLGTSRIVTQITKEAIDYAKANNYPIVDSVTIDEVCEYMGIDKNGLGKTHRALISVLVDRNNKPLGRKSLSRMINVAPRDIDEMYIPELTANGWATFDQSRGMIILTDKAMKTYGV